MESKKFILNNLLNKTNSLDFPTNLSKEKMNITHRNFANIIGKDIKSERNINVHSEERKNELKFKLKQTPIKFHLKNNLILSQQNNTFNETKKYIQEKTRNKTKHNIGEYNTYHDNKNKLILNSNNMTQEIKKLHQEILNLPLIEPTNSNNNNENKLTKICNALNLTMKNSIVKKSCLKKSTTLNNKIIIENENSKINNNNDILSSDRQNNTKSNQNLNNGKPTKKKVLFKLKTFTKENKIINEIKSEKYTLKISDKDIKYPKYPQVKRSHNSINKIIKSFAVNSYEGLIRNYNEDKVSIILTVKKPKNFKEEYWPKISYMALFDGHGGNSCSNFLRDNLHNYIIKNENLLKNTEKSIIESFEKAENDFINNIAIKENDKSGSCALVSLIIDNDLYIANCGDSHAIISINSGREIQLLNTIHRPNNIKEKERIIKNGGSIYIRNSIMRILPGRLSVSRAFGDKDAKLNDFGEKNNILICTPEVVKINLRNKKVDFLIMGCDGIFEYLSNEDCVCLAWKIMNENKQNYDNFHEMNGDIVDLIIKSALKRNSIDNVTALFVSFRNFQKYFNKGTIFSISNDSNINLNENNDEHSNKNENNNLTNKEHNRKKNEFNIVNNNNENNIRND